MSLPRFLLADNSEFPEDIYVLHTEYPRFLLNLTNDEVEWMDELKGDKEDDLVNATANLIEEAQYFYDREVARLESEAKG